MLYCCRRLPRSESLGKEYGRIVIRDSGKQSLAVSLFAYSQLWQSQRAYPNVTATVPWILPTRERSGGCRVPQERYNTISSS